MAQDLSLVSGASGHIFITALMSILLLHRCDGALIRILGGIFQRIKYQQDRVIRRGNDDFPRAKRNSGDRQTLY